MIVSVTVPLEVIGPPDETSDKSALPEMATATDDTVPTPAGKSAETNLRGAKGAAGPDAGPAGKVLAEKFTSDRLRSRVPDELIGDPLIDVVKSIPSPFSATDVTDPPPGEVTF